MEGTISINLKSKFYRREYMLREHNSNNNLRAKVNQLKSQEV